MLHARRKPHATALRVALQPASKHFVSNKLLDLRCYLAYHRLRPLQQLQNWLQSCVYSNLPYVSLYKFSRDMCACEAGIWRQRKLCKCGMSMVTCATWLYSMLAARSMLDLEWAGIHGSHVYLADINPSIAPFTHRPANVQRGAVMLQEHDCEAIWSEYKAKVCEHLLGMGTS